MVIDYYDIGGGTAKTVTQDRFAVGAVSENVPVLVGPDATAPTLQWNWPDPETLSYGLIRPGGTAPAWFVKGARIHTPTGERPIETRKTDAPVC